MEIRNIRSRLSSEASLGDGQIFFFKFKDPFFELKDRGFNGG